MKKSVLILGGARSGKSAFAQSLAVSLDQKVLFVATGEPRDEDMAQRIEQHKKARPAAWRTLEISTNVGRRLKGQIGDAGVVLLDCLTLLVSNALLNGLDDPDRLDAAAAEKRVTSEVRQLVNCMNACEGTFIVVSNEVGLGLVPDNRLGRVYRDLLGRANQLLVARCDEVYFMVSGIRLKIKG
ncbi:MAG: bifunctional adenosylcobinamide kinase/adenosylcobinamide-phosphate guanylyltransferase [Chloroflexota bacterium]